MLCSYLMHTPARQSSTMCVNAAAAAAAAAAVFGADSSAEAALLQVISGNFSVGLVQENGGAPVLGSATTNQAFVVPQGLIHYMYNPSCTPAAFTQVCKRLCLFRAIPTCHCVFRANFQRVCVRSELFQRGPWADQPAKRAARLPRQRAGRQRAVRNS